jgi:hypothetical protein
MARIGHRVGPLRPLRADVTMDLQRAIRGGCVFLLVGIPHEQHPIRATYSSEHVLQTSHQSNFSRVSAVRSIDQSDRLVRDGFLFLGRVLIDCFFSAYLYSGDPRYLARTSADPPSVVVECGRALLCVP